MIDDLVESFEDAWLAGKEPEITEFLPGDPLRRLRALWELVETELELSLRAGRPKYVEDFVQRFPELTAQPARLAEFVHSEYHIRSSIEPDLRFAEYLKRFPEIKSEIMDADAPAAQKRRFTYVSIGNHDVADEQIEHRGSSRFRLLRRIGEGGLGRVWAAWDQDFERQVAIKEIKPRIANQANSRRRFQTEATITAQLQHPGIPTVFARGNYPDGRPYYAMQIVEGSTLHEAISELHCVKRTDLFRNGLRQLLGRFVTICQTVHYAHSQGILHRDIKPRNVMLGEFGETLVLDWGLAKVLGNSLDSSRPADGRLGSATFGSEPSGTKTSDRIGSPGYMSPEQARHEHDTLTPSSDVYSLGATLHTLLTGKSPEAFDANDGNASSRPIVPGLLNCKNLVPTGGEANIGPASGIASRRDTRQTGSLSAELQLDHRVAKPLLSICSKATSLTLADRYKSAGELASDVERFLADDRVSCHFESWTERLTRFERRHRKVVRTSFVGLCLLSVALAASGIGMNRARAEAQNHAAAEQHAKRLAEASEARSNAVLGFMVNTIRKPDPAKSGRDVTVFETFEAARANLDERFGDDPIAKARILRALARSYRSLGLHDEALVLAQAAWELIRDRRSAAVGAYFEVLQELYNSYYDVGDYEKQRKLCRRFYDEHKAHFGPSDPGTVVALTDLTISWPHRDAASLLERELALVDATRPELQGTLAKLLRHLGRSLTSIAGRESDAVEPLRRAVAIAQAEFGEEAPQTLYGQYYLGEALVGCNQFDEAIEVFQSGQDRFAETAGQDHPHVLRFACSIADAHARAGRHETAVQMHEEVLARRRSVLPASHPGITMSLRQLGTACYFAADFESALEMLQPALTRLTTSVGVGDNRTVNVWRRLAACYECLGQTDRAIEELDAMLAADITRTGLRTARWAKARCLLRQGKYEQSAELCRQSHPEDGGLFDAILASALSRMGQLELTDADARMEWPEDYRFRDLDMALVLTAKAGVLNAQGSIDEAEHVLDEASVRVLAYHVPGFVEHRLFVEQCVASGREHGR